MKRVAAFCALAVALALILTGPVRAATPQGIQVKPLRNYPALDRGSTGTASLVLTNNTDAPQNISMSVETFGVTGENYDYTFGTSDEIKWISFTEPKFTLQPKQSKEISYSIAVPGDAAAGGHYFSLLTTIDPPTGGGGVTEIRRVASLLYLEVSGSITKKSSLTQLSLPWFSTKPVVPAEINLSNNGTSHIRARVSIEGRSWFSSLFHKPKQQYALVEGTIMPSTVRKLTTDVRLPNNPGVYQISAQYSPAQGGTSVTTKQIVYMPVWFLVVCLITICGIITAAVRTFGRHAKKRRAKD